MLQSDGKPLLLPGHCRVVVAMAGIGGGAFLPPRFVEPFLSCLGSRVVFFGEGPAVVTGVKLKRDKTGQ